MTVVGVLALQGDVREHESALAEVGAVPRLVRTPADLEGVAGIVLPGGESTTLSLLLGSSGLEGALGEALAQGMPAFGTCAGLLLLATCVLDGRPDQRSFGVLDCRVRRNGYGRQAQSFETVLDAPELCRALGVSDERLPAVFIRAPVIEAVGPGVEVLAVLGGPGAGSTPVVCRQGAVLASTFHPEMTPDRRLHRLFMAMIGAHPPVAAVAR